MAQRAAAPSGLVGLLLLATLPSAWAEDTVAASDLETAEAAEVAESDPPERFLDAVTVTATRSERTVDEVSGTVSVILRRRIEAEVMNDIRDLVRYEPGVGVASSASQVGVGGFTIRGVGGNRVLTRIDGVPVGEEFDFGHFEVPPYALSVEALESVEILRGAASSLYGSDAMGGVVSLVTRDPADYLRGERQYVGVHASWDGRTERASEAVTWAGSRADWQSSVHLNHSAGHEAANQGTIDTADASRTVRDPQDSRSIGLLGKVFYKVGPSNELELTAEVLDRLAETRVLSSQGITNLGAIFGFPPSITYLVDKPSVEARDEQDRWRLSLEQSLTDRLSDHLLWRFYAQSNRTEQQTAEVRQTTRGGGPFGELATSEVRREGLMRFEQDSLGGELQAKKALGSEVAHLMTFGLSVSRDRFDQLRDRPEIDPGTGELLPSSDGLIFPTKYFPESKVVETGLYGQAELNLRGGRLLVTPGLRYDSLDLGIDSGDEIFLSGNLGTEPPVEVHQRSLSPKLGMVASLGRGLSLNAHYARGFRAPPYSAVNSGFTHLAGGQTRLPNPDLRPETSDSLEIGLRGSLKRLDFTIGYFRSDYRDFIELVALGLNPATGLSEFQQRNVTRALISGFEAALEVDLGRGWELRSAAAWIDGEDRAQGVPLNSIQPPQVVVGVAKSPSDAPWRVELAGRLVAAKKAADLDNRAFDQFEAPAYEVFDLFGGWKLSKSLAINAGVLNLLDETYWEWAEARGRRQSSRVLDRYTEPGRKAVVSLRYLR